MSMAIADDNLLGTYLKDRRAKLDPAAFGFPLARRRTPGLRREEVAQRANVSATWYTWLEQGRGGAPSAEVLAQLAHALVLTEIEREHLFLLALGRPPEVRSHAPAGVSPQLQRVLDSLESSPAYVKTSAWDVLAWNAAAAAVLTDYATLAPDQRNILRLLFCTPHARAGLPDWESNARFAMAAFRTDVTRAGTPRSAQMLVEELRRLSPEFAAMWLDYDVRMYGEGKKFIQHANAGLIALEYSTFAIDGQPDLGMVIYTPATPADADQVRSLIARRTKNVRGVV